MKDVQFSLDDHGCFMLENFKKKFMIWVVPVTEVLSYLVRLVWSRAVYPRSFPSGHAKLSKFLYHQIVDRIEYISADYLLEPDHLPLAYTGHCLIRITDETLVLTGGKNGMEVNQM